MKVVNFSEARCTCNDRHLSCLQEHVDVHQRVRASNSPPFSSLKQAKFCQNHNVVVHTFHVTIDHSSQLTHRHLALALSCANDAPALV